MARTLLTDRRMSTFRTAACIVSSLGLVACIGGDAPMPQATCEPEGEARFLPVVEGASWTYETTDIESGLIERRTQHVGAFQEMDAPKAGIVASPQITEKETGMIVNWQEDTGTAVIRHRQIDQAGDEFRDDLYEDYKQRLDESPERLVEGATYSHSYVARMLLTDEVENRVEDWEVVSDGEWVEVPAGRFCAMQITRQRTTDGEVGQIKRYWFARGVGKVMERSEKSIEELLEFHVP